MTRLRTAIARGPVRLAALGLAAVLVVAAGTAEAQTTGGTRTLGHNRGTPTARNKGTARQDLVPNQYIVVFKTQSVRLGSAPTAASGLVKTYGGVVAQTFGKALNGFTLNADAATANRVAADPSVAYVEQVQRFHASDTDNNPKSWGLDRIDQAYWPLDGKYTFPNTASNVTAYVVDTGIDYAHQEFGGRAVAGFDAFGGDGSDCKGHGTHVAGTIGGSSAGVARGVRLVSVRVLDCTGVGTTASVISGLNWIMSDNTHRPAVANMSLGGGQDQAIDDAVNNLINNGVTVAVAAGNAVPDPKTGLLVPQDSCGLSPADVDGAITVGAVDQGDVRASFSDYGTCIDLYAPGVDIVSADFQNNTGYVTMSGTSMATPHVAGAAALLLSEHPTWTPAQVQQAIVSTTNKSHRILDINGSNPPSTPPPAESWHTANPPTGVHTNNRPALVTNAGREDMFVNSSAPGHPLMHVTGTGGVWGSWESLGGSITGNPVAVWSSAVRLDVFVTGSDTSVWHNYLVLGSGWHGWEPLGGKTKADLVVAQPEPGTVDLFAVGADTGIWHRVFDGYGWNDDGWENFGGRTLGHNFSVVVDPASGGEVIFVQANNGSVYFQAFDQAFFYGWEPIGGVVKNDVKAVITSDGKIDVFAPGSNSTVWHRRWDGNAWQPWEQLGGVTVGDGFEAVASDAGIVDLYVLGADHTTWSRRWDGTAWGAWGQLNPNVSQTIPRATDNLTYQEAIAFPLTDGSVFSAQFN